MAKMTEMTEKIKVGVIGATGYAGAELIRLLSFHPHIQLESISSVSFHGKRLSDIYPGYRGVADKVLEKDHKSMLETCKLVFAALPHGLSQETGKECYEKGIIFIDLGADFRLENEDEYRKWYNGEFLDAQLQQEAVYGLSEIYREEIKTAKIIANPGCYPTSVSLALYPALKYGMIESGGIIIDSKSGVTGGGRGLSQKTHFPECNESFAAYSTGIHRHEPEINQVLTNFAGEKITTVFSPHLLPVNRGILSTIYCDLKKEVKDVMRVYEETYKGETFIKVLKEGEYANIRNVRLSNSCHISIHFAKSTGKLIICSAIDNMIKGAAGQAIQNMNIVMGWQEDAGLTAMAPPF